MQYERQNESRSPTGFEKLGCCVMIMKRTAQLLTKPFRGNSNPTLTKRKRSSLVLRSITKEREWLTRLTKRTSVVLVRRRKTMTRGLMADFSGIKGLLF